MAKLLKRLGLGLLGMLVLGVMLLWSADTDKAEMIAKYGTGASQFVTDSQGMTIHYREEGNPDGPVIVLLHGSGGSLHTWTDMNEKLSETYRLVSLDFPGHGLTGPDPERDYSAGSLLGAVETVMDAVGVDQAVIAGNSMGGWAAWRFALSFPDRVTGLILIDASGPQIAEKTNPYLAARIIRSKPGQIIALKITPRAIVRKTLAQVMYDEAQITEGLVDRYWELARFPGNRQAMVDRSNTDRESGYWERAGEIVVPTLILWGQHDVTTPLAFAQAFDETISNTHLITYPNAAHLPMEEIPGEVARDIRSWMGVNFP